MKRGEFIGFAAMFAAFYKLPFTPTQNELFSFDNSLLQGLLKDMPAHQKETALLMVKNLLFDLDYILKQSNNKSDLATIKKLAEEADNKFYVANKIKGTSFVYHPLTLTKLEAMKSASPVGPAKFDAMVKSLKLYVLKINTSKDKFEKFIPELIRSAAESAKASGEAKAECGPVISTIAAIITAVVIAVIAVIVSNFSGGKSLASTKIFAAAGQVANSINLPSTNVKPVTSIVVASSGIKIKLNDKNLTEEAIKLSWTDFDKKMRCIFLSLTTAVTMNQFGNKKYPLHPIIGSLAVNIIGIVRQLPIENDC